MAAHHFRNHLDRAALLFQLGADSCDEAVRSQAENQNLSGADAGRDELVPLVGAGNRVCGTALLLDPSQFRCQASGRSVARGQMVWLVVYGVACGVRVYLCAAATDKGIRGQPLGALDWSS